MDDPGGSAQGAATIEPPWPPPVTSRLGELLLREGMVTPAALSSALAAQSAGSEWRLGRLLVLQGALDHRSLTHVIAKQFHVGVADPSQTPPERAALRVLTREPAQQLQGLPLRLEGERVVIAVSDPPTRELRIALERSAGMPVTMVLCPADELEAALEYWYAPERDLEAEPDSLASPAVPAEAAEAPRAAPTASARTDDQIVPWLLTHAVERGANAVHLDQEGTGLRVRYRVDGALEPGPRLKRAAGSVVCERVLASATLAPRGAGAWEGTFDAQVAGIAMTVQVVMVTTATGSHIVLRPTSRPEGSYTLEDLGVGSADAALLRTGLRSRKGLFVLAAPTLPLRQALCVAVRNEIGLDDRLIALVRGSFGVTVPNVVEFAVDGATTTEDAVNAAELLDAEAIVVDGARDPDATRVAFNLAAGPHLVVLVLDGTDAIAVVTEAVDAIGEVLVAGALAAVIVGRGDPVAPLATAHLVTDEVRAALIGDGSATGV